MIYLCVFFVKQKTADELRISDWSSDVCSSDLTEDEVRAAAADMLGNTLVTVQTGDAGKQVNRLYVTDGVDIAHEFYLALLVDRVTGRVAFVVSTEGGDRKSTRLNSSH